MCWPQELLQNPPEEQDRKVAYAEVDETMHHKRAKICPHYALPPGAIQLVLHQPMKEEVVKNLIMLLFLAFPWIKFSLAYLLLFYATHTFLMMSNSSMAFSSKVESAACQFHL